MVQLMNMITSGEQFRIWAAGAKPRDRITYHIGNLAIDRANNSALHDLAEMIRLLQETGWVIQSTNRVNLAAIRGHAYFVTRTGGGYAPRCILNNSISARHYRAMQALRDRVGYVSAQRAVRDALATNETDAADILAYLYARRWVEEAPEKGFRVSDAGVMAML